MTNTKKALDMTVNGRLNAIKNCAWGNSTDRGLNGYNPTSPNPIDHRIMLNELQRIEDNAARARTAVVQNMRAQGMTWANIGEALGVSRQAAQQQFGRD